MEKKKNPSNRSLGVVDISQLTGNFIIDALYIYIYIIDSSLHDRVLGIS